MVKYHVTADGPKKCSAAPGNCPLDGDHFESLQEASENFESKMGNPHSIPLSREINLENLQKMIAEEYIDYRVHPDDPSLKVLCYTRTAQYDGKWNDETKMCRGLIVQGNEDDFSDAVIIQRPWKKFYSLDQHSNGWSLGDDENEHAADELIASIDFNAPAEVLDKVDGSMVVLYKAPDGSPAFATKGSFTSDQAIYYTKMLRKNEKLLKDAENLLKENNGDNTFIFEAIGRNNQIVVDYEDDDIVLLGAVEKQTGIYLSPGDYSDKWSAGVAETMPAESIAEAFELPDRENREGVVIRVKSTDPDKQLQLKIKQEDYKTIHKALSSFGKADFRKALEDSGAPPISLLLDVAESGDVEKLPGVKEAVTFDLQHPGLAIAREERLRIFRETVLPRLETLKKSVEYVDNLDESAFQGDDAMKRFAMSIKDKSPTEQSNLFAIFRSKLFKGNIEDFNSKRFLKNISKSF